MHNPGLNNQRIEKNINGDKTETINNFDFGLLTSNSFRTKRISFAIQNYGFLIHSRLFYENIGGNCI